MNVFLRNVGCVWKAAGGGLDTGPLFETGRSRHNPSRLKPFCETSPSWLRIRIKPLVELAFTGA